jgi:hypothetical protein
MDRSRSPFIRLSSNDEFSFPLRSSTKRTNGPLERVISIGSKPAGRKVTSSISVGSELAVEPLRKLPNAKNRTPTASIAIVATNDRCPGEWIEIMSFLSLRGMVAD